MNRILRTSLLIGAAVLLPACIEADVDTELKADGSGSFGISMKFTEKFVAIARKLEKLDPKQEAVTGMKDMMLEKPDAEALAAFEKKGLTLEEFEAVNDEKRMGVKVRVGFKTLSSLTDFDSLMEKKDGKDGKSGNPADDMALVHNEDGTYTLTLGMKSDEGGDDGVEEAGDAGDAEGEGEAADEAGHPELTPEESAKRMQEMMPLLGEMMGEAQNLRFTVVLKVPGEVVEFTPATGAKKEDGKVTWTLDFQTMMASAMGGDENPMEKMSVRFRMPEGQAIPGSALWGGKAAKAVAAPEAPPAKEEAPAGGPK